MADQIIDAVMARSIQADAERRYPLLGWVVMRDHPDYPGELIARFVTDAPTPYVLVSDTLAGLHAQPNCRSVWCDRSISHRTHLRWWKSGFLLHKDGIRMSQVADVERFELMSGRI